MSDTPKLAIIISKLREFNLWRRGNEESVEQPNPVEVGKCIDAICNMAESLNHDLDVALNTLEKVALLDASQLAPNVQCDAVALSMNTLKNLQ